MIEWLTQTKADLPTSDPTEWLADSERERLECLATPKRRADWLLGRWTAKRLVQAVILRERGERPTLRDLVIEREADGAPRLRDYPEWSLSLSHSQGKGLAVLLKGGLVGADLERVEARASIFVDDYFTEEEQAVVGAVPAEERDRWITGIWSAKEAALKALRVGLGVDTRAVSCVGTRLDGEWSPVRITADAGQLRTAPMLQGWWRLEGGYVLSTAISEQPIKILSGSVNLIIDSL
jgi:4'-phosphopantetheinyl transferase